MKRLFLLACLVLAASPRGSAAQARIDLYADATMSGCELVDQGNLVHEVHMFYAGPPATAVRFSAPKPACWTGATWLGDAVPFTIIGDSQMDLSIGFGVCLGGPVYLGSARYFATGQSASCCVQTVLPGYQFVYADCEFGEHPLVAGQNLVINPDASCRCRQPLPTEPATWGRVKSLYR